MYTETGKILSELPKEDVINWIKSFDNIFFDCDGVIWNLFSPIPGSCEVVNKLKEIGKNVYYVTNNSLHSRAEQLQKTKKFKLNADESEIICSPHVIASHLKKIKFDKKVYVIGSTGITQELDLCGIKHTGSGPEIVTKPFTEFIAKDMKIDPDVGAVLVAMDVDISFAKMIRATTYLNNPNVEFYGSCTDENFPTPFALLPVDGCFIAALEFATSRKATTFGKPSSLMIESLIKDKQIDPKRSLMVGDRSNTDIVFGKNCGFKTMLVETGVHNRNDVKSWIASNKSEDKILIPDMVVSSLAELLQYL